MWHALRAELAYSRPWVLGGLGIAAGVILIVSVIFFAVGDDGPPSHAAAGIRGMFVILAPLIVGFVAQAYRSEERRARLLLMGPLTPRQIAAVTVLLPTFLFGVGLLAAGALLGAESLVTGRFETEAVHIVVYVGSLLFMMNMMGLLAQEATAARGQRRTRAAAAGWAGFVLAVLLLATLSLAAFVVQGPLTWITLHLGNLIVAVAAMVGSVALYTDRNDFTR